MAFLQRLLRALTSLLAGIGHALSSAASATGRGVRSVAGSAAAVVPGPWKQRIALLFCTGLALVPIVYAGNMTWSFNDPSGHLDEVTAAVVDADTGATITGTDGTTRDVHVGRDFTDTLLDLDKNTVYTFVKTDQATADKGIADGTYGAVVEIPSTFSADIGSLGGADPLAATPGLLTIRTNDSINYVSGNFTKSVGTALKDSLTENVLDQYLDNVYLGFTTVHDQLVDAANGADQLVDGSTQLHDGTGQAITGSQQLADGAAQLDSGSYDLVIGLGQLSTGADSLATGSGRLADGASTLNSGLHTLDAQSPTLRSGAQKLADGSGQAATGSRTLASGASQLADGTQQLDDRVSAAQRRAQDLGINQTSVDQASQDLTNAANGLADVATTVNQSLTDPARLANGLAKDTDGVADTVDTAATDARGLANRTSTAGNDAKTFSQSASTVATESQTAHDDATKTSADATKTVNSADALLGSGDGAAPDSVTGYTKKVDQLEQLCKNSDTEVPSDGGGDAGSGSRDEICQGLTEISGESQHLRDNTQGVGTDARAVVTDLNGDGTAKNPGVIPSTQAAANTANGMTQPAQSIDTLLNGDGTDQNVGLVKTTDSLATAIESARQPTRKVADDAQGIATGIGQAQDAAQDPQAQRDAVQQRIDELHRQATAATTALPTAFDEARQAAGAVHQINAGAQQVDSGAQSLASANGQLAAGAGTLDRGVDQYTDGVSQAAQGSGALVSGADQLHDGATQLADGARSAQDGAEQLHDGAGRLEDGATQLHDGAVQLDDGAAQLQDGSQQLADGLHDGADKVPSYDEGQRDHLASAASDPVGLDFVRDHDLQRFGKGLAPLFLSIGLWVGGMAIFLMMPPLSERAARNGSGPLALLAGGLIPAQLLGLVQTAIALVILHNFVGITAVQLPEFVAMAALTSVVFVALNHGFGAMFGPVGKFVALVLIALQVSGAGGTYPVKTLPGFFQAIHPWLPMSHAIDAFRGTIGGGWVDPVGDIAWLCGWLAVALALGLFAAIRMHRNASRDMAGAIPAEA